MPSTSHPYNNISKAHLCINLVFFRLIIAFKEPFLTNVLYAFRVTYGLEVGSSSFRVRLYTL
jgi:hypothetical protein